jgi:protoporphyrinogen/coproporphyrinogen III oxidase
MNYRPRIAIVGAGISGLALGFRLKRAIPDLDLTILESQSTPGGNVSTKEVEGFRVEQGPNGFLDSKLSTMQLCRDLGIDSELIPASEGSRKNRYVFWDNRLQALPGSLPAFLRSKLLSFRGKFQFATESFRSRRPDSIDDESIHDFATRRAGKEVANLFADALVTGIFGGDPKLLSMRSCFPRLWKMESEFGSVVRGMKKNRKQKQHEALSRGEPTPGPQRMWSFHQGLGRLVERLSEVLSDALQLNCPVRSFHRKDGQWQLWTDQKEYSFDHMVLTNPAYSQSQLIREWDTELAEELASIQYTGIAVVVVGYHQDQIGTTNLDGFGYIVPQAMKRDILGVQWCSSIFPDRAPPGKVLWRALCGGWQRPDILDWNDHRLIQSTHREIQQAIPITGNPCFTQIVRWPKAIPQYFLGHHAKVKSIEARSSKHSGLWLGGNALHGVALNDCTEQAELLSTRIVASLNHPGN